MAGSNPYWEENITRDINLELIVIPSGSFNMGSSSIKGSSDERPPHTVEIKSFSLGKYPVTQTEWKAVAKMPKVRRTIAESPSRFQGTRRPVERVSWEEAIEFCNRLSRHSGREYRLPSEAEWEYACRAGTDTPFFCGKVLSLDLASYTSNSETSPKQGTATAENFPNNDFGLCDMHGNVWEWCQDSWHDNYRNAPTDGSAWLSSDKKSEAVLRGGAWNVSSFNCRSARRWGRRRNAKGNNNGLRIACSNSELI